MCVRLSILVLLSMTLLGCKPGVLDVQGPAPEAGEGIKIGVQGMSLDTESAEGVKLPEDFPTDVAMPADAKAIAVINLDSGTTITFEIDGNATHQPIPALLDEYKSQMLANGWEVKASVSTSVGGSLTLANEARIVAYSVSKKDQKIFVVITLTKKH